MVQLLVSTAQLAQFSSVQDGIYVLGKAITYSSLPLRSSPNIVFETVPMALSRPFKEDRLAIPLSMPLSSS